jgi:hypothetical protein
LDLFATRSGECLGGVNPDSSPISNSPQRCVEGIWGRTVAFQVARGWTGCNNWLALALAGGASIRFPIALAPPHEVAAVSALPRGAGNKWDDISICYARMQTVAVVDNYQYRGCVMCLR